MIKKFFFSLKCAGNGLITVYKEEQNFKIEFILGIIAVILGIFLEITKTEMIFIIICIILVMTAEIVNTAMEDLCDKVEPNQNEKIGKIKDIMAGFVLITSLGSLIVACMIFLPKFYSSLNN